MTAEWLTELERSLAEDEADVPTALVVAASVAGRGVPLDEEQTRAASRRALLVLAAGGDPSRGLDLNGRAVEVLAADLDDAERRAALERGLEELRDEALGLAHVSEVIHALLEDPGIAWRAYACSLLAEELGGGDE